MLFLICLSAKYDKALDTCVKNHLSQIETLVKNLKGFANLKELIIDEAENYTRKRNIFRFDCIIDECPPSLKRLSLTSINSIDEELRMIPLSNTTSVQTSNDISHTLARYSGLLSPRPNLIGYVDKDDDQKVIELVTTFIESTAETKPTLVSVKLIYQQYEVLDFADVDPDIIEPTFLKISSSENPNTDIHHRWATTSRVYSINVDAQLNKHINDIVSSGSSINEHILKKVGAKMNHLRFCARYRIVPFLSNEKYIATTLSNELDIIFKYCTSLTAFDLGWIRLFNGVSNEQVINKSISCLRFDNCWISRDALPALSSRLPGLKSLTIENCLFDRDIDGPAIFNMPDTSLELLKFYFTEVPLVRLLNVQFKVTLSISGSVVMPRAIVSVKMSSTSLKQTREITPQH